MLKKFGIVFCLVALSVPVAASAQSTLSVGQRVKTTANVNVRSKPTNAKKNLLCIQTTGFVGLYHDADVATVLVPALGKASRERRKIVAAAARQHRDYRHRRLLRACRERPSSCRAAEERDELAAFHSMTSSAATSSLSGTVSPSIVAV